MPDHPVLVQEVVPEADNDELGISVRVQAINLAFQMYHTVNPSSFENAEKPPPGADLTILGYARTIEAFLLGD